MSVNTPDRWVVLQITSGDQQIQKVFAGWYGGYGGSDSWQLSSGIVKVNTYDDRYEFVNKSGSLYICYKCAYGMSGYQQSLYSGWTETLKEQGNGTMEIVDYE